MNFERLKGPLALALPSNIALRICGLNRGLLAELLRMTKHSQTRRIDLA